MRKLIQIITLFLFISCGENKKHGDLVKSTLNGSSSSNTSHISLSQPSILIIEFDSLETENLRLHNEDQFYTAADDIMWYNSLLIRKMDSLNIPIYRTNKDTVKLSFENSKFTIVKDTSFIYTYYFFDGKKIKREYLIDLLDI